MIYRKRKLGPAQLVSSLAASAALAFAGFGLAGCDLQQPVSFSVTPLSGGAATTSGGLGSYTLLTIQGQTSSQFTLDASSNALFKSSTLAIVGTCALGTSQVQLTINSVVQSTLYSCPASGNLTINLASKPDGIYSLIFTPLGGDGNPTASTPITQAVRLKNTVPGVSGIGVSPIVSNSGNNYVVNAGSITITGLFSPTASDSITSVVETSGAGTMTFTPLTAGNWTYVVNVAQGTNLSLNFEVLDSLGNISTITTVGVGTTNGRPNIADFSAGGTSTTVVGTLNKLVGFTSGPVLGSTATGTSTANTLYFGVPNDDAEGP